MTASPVKRLRVHYTGRLEDGTVFDSTREREPLTVPLGMNRIIRGLEEALEGMAAGESGKVTVPPAKAYGPHRAELVTVMERGRFPENLELRVGQHLELKGHGGMVARVRVTALSEKEVTIDANHPLAGKTLLFDVEVLEVIP